jgi:ribosomal protein L22
MSTAIDKYTTDIDFPAEGTALQCYRAVLRECEKTAVLTDTTHSGSGGIYLSPEKWGKVESNFTDFDLNDQYYTNRSDSLQAVMELGRVHVWKYFRPLTGSLKEKLYCDIFRAILNEGRSGIIPYYVYEVDCGFRISGGVWENFPKRAAGTRLPKFASEEEARNAAEDLQNKGMQAAKKWLENIRCKPGVAPYEVFPSENGVRVCGGIWRNQIITAASPLFATVAEAEKAASNMREKKIEEAMIWLQNMCLTADEAACWYLREEDDD